MKTGKNTTRFVFKSGNFQEQQEVPKSQSETALEEVMTWQLLGKAEEESEYIVAASTFLSCEK